jgi:hypothetical protein
MALAVARREDAHVAAAADGLPFETWDVDVDAAARACLADRLDALSAGLRDLAAAVRDDASDEDVDGRIAHAYGLIERLDLVVDAVDDDGDYAPPV